MALQIYYRGALRVAVELIDASSRVRCSCYFTGASRTIWAVSILFDDEPVLSLIVLMTAYTSKQTKPLDGFSPRYANEFHYSLP